MKKIKKTVKYFMMFMLVSAFGVGIISMGYVVSVLASADNIDTFHIRDMLSETSVVYDEDGQKVKTLNDGKNRAYVTYDEIPSDLVNAYVALEDKTFFEHHGFNVKRICGAIIESLRSNSDIGGTSTITQQLARNIYLTRSMEERTIRRKLLEAWYSVQIEQSLSKEQIMEYYLNTINLGFGNYGVKTASTCYFGKSLDDLTVSQCAALAALPQAPSSYALVQFVDSSTAEVSDFDKKMILEESDDGMYVANDLEKERRQVCLSLMHEQNYISDDVYKEAKNTELLDMLDVNIPKQNTVMSYFVDHAVDVIADDLETELAIEHDEAIDMIYSGGLRIHTTLDQKIQDTINDKFSDDSNFPGIYNIRYNENDNIINDNGDVILYDKDYLFEDGKYKLKRDYYQLSNSDTLFIEASKRLGFSQTEEGWDLLLPDMYKKEDGELYIIEGGTIYLPTDAAREDADYIVIDPEYLRSEEGQKVFDIDGSDVYINESACHFSQSIIQPQAAMTIIENDTGRVKAMVGGRNVKGNMVYNRATAPHQPGSSIKPITVYSAALQQSADEAKAGRKHRFIDYEIDNQGVFGWGDYITAGSYVVDEKTVVNGRAWPTNAGGGYYGGGSLRTALINSINTCAYKIWLQTGLDYSMLMGERFGLTTIVSEGEVNDANPAALALGGMTKGVSTLEMANAYTVFANNGTKSKEPVFYTKVTDAEGNVILSHDESEEEVKVLSSSVAYIMRDMMQDVVKRGTGTRARVYETSAGGKTGTTSSEYDIWFDGFTPRYSASLWIGNDRNMSLTGMSEYAAGLWGEIMNDIPDASEGNYPKKPNNVVLYNGEYYVEGTI